MTRMEEVREELKKHYQAIHAVIDLFLAHKAYELKRELSEFAEKIDEELGHE